MIEIETYLSCPGQLSGWLAAMDKAAQLLRTGQKIIQHLTPQGLYEVLEYEATLELQNQRGDQALFRKREKVRYLQNNVIAHRDQMWGDGKFWLNYRCTPGIAVDRYRPDQKTYVLISLHEVRNRGDIAEFNVERKIQGGFLRRTEVWETDVNHKMRKLKVQVVFPRKRPPRRLSLIENNSQKTYPLGQAAQVELPDGRWLVAWETFQPRIHERYILKWDW